MKMTDTKSNILVITIGTREVQIHKDQFPNDIFEIDENYKWIQPKQEPENKIAVYSNQDFPKYLSFSEPRKVGEAFDNHEAWQEYICFPIIQPLLDYLNDKQVILHYVLLVDTDQEETFKQRAKDTLFFSHLVQNQILKSFSRQKTSIQFETITVKKDVTNIDKLYPLMESKGRHLFQLKYEDIDQVYLFPQGGIDQINQSLMLKLIQHYRNKVIQFQNAENNQVIPLKFPAWFIRDLNREKLRKHIYDFSFSLVDISLTDDQRTLEISEFASRKLELDFSASYITKNILKEWIEINNEENKIKNLYIAAKINYYRKEYSAYLWKLFTLSENFFKIYVAKYFDVNLDLLYDKKCKPGEENAPWVNILKSEEGLYEKLTIKSKSNDKSVDLNNPNRLVFKKILSFLNTKDKLPMSKEEYDLQSVVFNRMDKLSDLRNDIAHYLRPLKEDDLLIDLGKGYFIPDLNNDIDKIFKLKDIKDFGIYSNIKDYLLEFV